jgi:hypothetical protein
LSGRLSIRLTSTTPPTDEDEVSMSGVAPLTVIDSCTLATFNVTLTSSVWPTLRTIALLSNLAKP